MSEITQEGGEAGLEPKAFLNILFATPAALSRS